VAVITSDLPDTVLPEIERFGLKDVFNDVVTKVYKKTDSLRVLINNNHLDSNNTYIVGDSNNEISTAKELGVKSIAVTWGFATEQKLMGFNPDYVVHSVKELERVL